MFFVFSISLLAGHIVYIEIINFALAFGKNN